MSRAKFPLLFTALALAIAMFALQSTVVALQDPASSPSAQQERDPAAAPSTAMPQASDTQTFTGKIAKAGGKYVLKDMTNKMTYLLDDQEKAKEFEGKSVKVTGMLDTRSNTIRVAAIEPGS